MALNGIDISSNNEGINLSRLSMDFVIIKATQGKTYVNPYYSKWVKVAKAKGFLIGVYHYISGIGAKDEAAAFYKTIKDDADSVMICIDWEKIQNNAWGNTEYLRAFIKELQKLLPGRRFMLYASQSVFPTAVAKEFNCGSWVAQYANYNKVNGFQSKPWNEGAYSCDIRQYTEYGYLSGWSGRLDFNKAYMTKNDWAKWLGKSSGNATESKPSETVKKDANYFAKLAAGVLSGKYGDGKTRKAKLGADYSKVQAIINEVTTASNKNDTGTLVAGVMSGKYGNGSIRSTILGKKYIEVQALVNLVVNGTDKQLAAKVKAGAYGNGETRKTCLGDRYAAVQKIVNG